MIWFAYGVLVGFLVGACAGFVYVLGMVAKHANKTQVAACDHSGCRENATVPLNINGDVRYACPVHVGDVVRTTSRLGAPACN